MLIIDWADQLCVLCFSCLHKDCEKKKNHKKKNERSAMKP